MSFIPKEIPSWVIDWINTTFTFLNDIDYITSLYVDGAIYIDFIREWARTVILTDAPTSTIFGDYYTADSILPIETNTKLWDVKTKIWRLLGQQSNSVNYNSEVLNEEINDFMQNLWRGKVINPITKQYIRTWDMYFQENFYSFRISKDSVTTAPVAIWDTSIAMSTVWLAGAGWVMIWGDYIKYTSTTTTSIEWVSGITTSHNEWVVVKPLYAVPENYDMLIEMDEVSYQYSWVSYTPIETDGRVSFDVLRIGGIPVLEIKGLAYDTIVRTKYITKYVDMSDDNEDFKLPDRYGTSAIAPIIAGELAYDKMLPQAERLMNKGYEKLLEMVDFYTRKTKNKTKFRAKPYAKIWRTSR